MISPLPPSDSSHLPLSLLFYQGGQGPPPRSLLRGLSALSELGSFHQGLFSWVTSHLENNPGDGVGTEGLVGQTAGRRQLFPAAVPARAPGQRELFSPGLPGMVPPREVPKERRLTPFCTESFFFSPLDLRIFFRWGRRGEMERKHSRSVGQVILSYLRFSDNSSS